MKKLLLGALCLATTSLSAQDFTPPTLRVKVKVIPTASEKFDVNSLEITGDGIIPEDVIWDAANTTFEFTMPAYGFSRYQINSADNLIGYEGSIHYDFDWENPNLPQEVLVLDTADFRGYYYVDIVPASDRYDLEVDYLGKPRTPGSDTSIGIIEGVFTGRHENATYIKPGDYECEALVWENETKIPIVTGSRYFTMGEQDMTYQFNAEMEKKHLVTIDVKDTENKPLAGADLNFGDTNYEVSVRTDDMGRAQIYMNDGTYQYAPDIEEMTLFFDPSSIAEFTVSGSDVQTTYSFLNQGLYKHDIIITGDQIREVEMDLYSAYIYEDCDLMDEDVQNNRTVLTFYAPKGKYCYNLDAGDRYNHVNYFPAHGIIEVNGNGSTEFHFTNNGQKKLLVTTTDLTASEMKIYDENGMKVKECGIAYANEGSASRAVEGGEADALLLPGKYTLVIEGTDDMNQQKHFYTKEIEVAETDSEIRVDFKASELAKGTLLCQPKNIPGIFPSELGATLYNSQGIELDYIHYSTYNEYSNYEYMLTPGEYTLRWENHLSGDYNSEPVIFKYQESLTVKDGATIGSSLDFNQMATTKVLYEKPEHSEIYGMEILRDGNPYYVDFIYDTNEDYFYFVSEPGNFQIKSWGQSYDSMGMNLFSERKDFTQTQGQNEQTVNLKLEETGADMSCIILVNDIHAEEIRNATLTVNGKVLKADNCAKFYLDNIKDDVLNITLEAPGYAPLHFTKNVHPYERSIFNMMEICFFMFKTNEATGIQETPVETPVVVRTAADKFEVGGTFTSDCRYRIVDMQGVTLANGNVTSTQNQISVGTLPSGIYVLILENGKQRQTIKFVK